MDDALSGEIQILVLGCVGLHLIRLLSKTLCWCQLSFLSFLLFLLSFPFSLGILFRRFSHFPRNPSWPQRCLRIRSYPRPNHPHRCLPRHPTCQRLPNVSTDLFFFFPPFISFSIVQMLTWTFLRLLSAKCHDARLHLMQIGILLNVECVAYFQICSNLRGHQGQVAWRCYLQLRRRPVEPSHHRTVALHPRTAWLVNGRKDMCCYVEDTIQSLSLFLPFSLHLSSTPRTQIHTRPFPSWTLADDDDWWWLEDCYTYAGFSLPLFPLLEQLEKGIIKKTETKKNKHSSHYYIIFFFFFLWFITMLIKTDRQEIASENLSPKTRGRSTYNAKMIKSS